MSQHDFNIANQTFPSFRADLNDALQAAATISAGATAPTTPYAYQLWFDTSTNTYKARNAANSAWISLFGNDLTNGGITFGTNDKAIFGAGSDLQIYHDGGSSWVSDVGAGNLKLTSDGAGVFLQKGATEFMGEFLTDGAVRLYHDNAAKFETTATGVDVTGAISSNKGSAGVLATFTDGVNSNFVVETSSLLTTIGNGGGSTALAFKANNTEAMRISSGSVGIGTISPLAKFHVDNTNSAFYMGYGGNEDIYLQTTNGNVLFTNKGATTEYMRIDGATGNVLVGTSTAYGQVVSESSASKFQFASHNTDTSGASQISFRFMRNTSDVGSITTTSSATAYNTSSDYRLKTAVNYDWDATTRLKQLKPARFEWIADGDDAVPVDGFLAHEVEDIVPESITGTKDAMRDEEYQVSAATGDIYTPAIDAVLDEDGNEVTPAVAEVIHSADVERPEELAEGQQWRETTAAVMGTRSVPDYQGIDQSKLVPLLVKTIQELEARITALEA